MKKLISALLILISFTSYSQVKVVGSLTTPGVALFPTHIDSLAYGAYRVCYDTTERNSITCLRRKYGMAVYTQKDTTLWILRDSACNNVWVKFSSGSGGGGGIDTAINTGYGLNQTLAGTTKTIIADSSKLATLSNINTAQKWPAETTLGTIYNKQSWSDLSDFTLNPSGTNTVALSGNYVNISANRADYTNWVRILPNRPTHLNNWKLTIQFKITAWSGTSYWFGPEIKSLVTHNGANFGYMFFCNTSSSGSGTMYLMDETGGSNLGSTAGSTKHLNDVIEMSLTFNDSTLTATERNITTASSTTTLSYTFPDAANIILPNLGTWAVMQNGTGGTVQIQSVVITSNDTKNTNLLVIGDSKTKVGYADAYPLRYWEQLKANYPTVNAYAGSAEFITDAMQANDELYQTRPAQVLMASIGENDLRTGVPLATVEANYAATVKWFSDGGATVYHAVFPEDSTGGANTGIGLTNFKNWVASTYPNTYIDTWDSMSVNNVLKAAYNHGDGVHTNQAGQNKIYQTIVASGLIKTINPNRRAAIRTTDGNVQVVGDSAYLSFPIINQVRYFFKSYASNGNNKPGLSSATLMYEDNSQITVSSRNPRDVPYNSNFIFRVDGAMRMMGTSGQLSIEDRSNSSNVVTNYFNNNTYTINLNGLDQIQFDTSGRWRTGFANNGIQGTFQLKKNYVLGGVLKTIGTGINSDSVTVTLPNGGLGTTSHNLFAAPTYTATSSSNITIAATNHITGAPIAGANMVITRPVSQLVDSGEVKLAGFATGYISKATSYTATSSDNVIEVTATGQTITLPTAVNIIGRQYKIKLTASGTATVSTTSSQTIDGATTYSLSAQYKYVEVTSNGANWIITANN